MAVDDFFCVDCAGAAVRAGLPGAETRVGFVARTAALRTAAAFDAGLPFVVIPLPTPLN
ncbi:hypothetical protein APY04_2089 [Hyphomicrobium sulfonivorans]|uniref:Uncharacterized protein n=1 Tax=Hyphomicrobium sulfonivorans TaxID=121290 RepID=A0A109BEA7_HYPSL|nr:hypothetical protein APY04_2089 [Hyphomicrobium sulfonivorans]